MKFDVFISIGRKTPTPNKGASGSKTPNGGAGGDRFIPNRASSNFDMGHYKVRNLFPFSKWGHVLNGQHQFCFSQFKWNETKKFKSQSD